jgi:hypothetical protein
MSFKTIKYFKQSDENSNNLVALDAWQVSATKDSTGDNNSNKLINSVTLKIFGNSYQFSYRDFATIIQQESDYIADLTGVPMPIAIRAIQDNTYVIERPPFKTSVRLNSVRANMVRNEASVLCDVWIPWTVCFLTMPSEKNPIPSLRMFYNDGPLSSFEDNLITPWTPNFHHTGDICLGQTTANFMDAVSQNVINPKNVSEIYHYLVNDYFNGGWNLDLGGGLVYTMCNLNIGKFTTDPLNDPDLNARATKAKIKIKGVENSRSRQTTKIKNSYLTWSLMDLPEVLNAVNEYRKINRASWKVSQILQQNIDNDSLNEKESIGSLIRSMHLSNSRSVKTGIDWSIIINFSKEVIENTLVDQEIISRELIENYSNSIHCNTLCQNAAKLLVEQNEELFLSFIKSSLEIIANNILKGSTLSEKIESNFDDIVQNKEHCNSVLQEKS